MTFKKPPPGAEITQREIEVLTLLAKGLSNDEIGGALGISKLTVQQCCRGIYYKLGVDGRAEAGVRACEMGLHCTPAAAQEVVPDALICTILVMEGHEPGAPIDAAMLRRFSNRLAAQVRQVAR